MKYVKALKYEIVASFSEFDNASSHNVNIDILA